MWISLLTKFLTVVDIIICLLLILLVLLQRPKNEGLGAAFGGDTASNLFGAQTTNVLANLTRWMGGLFLAICLTIAILGKHDATKLSKIEVYIEKAKKEKADEEKQKTNKKAANDAAAEALKKNGASPDTKPPATDSQIPLENPATPPAPSTEPPKSGSTKPPKPKPSETKPADVKPAGTKAAESNPAGAKPANAKPAETKPGNAPLK